MYICTYVDTTLTKCSLTGGHYTCTCTQVYMYMYLAQFNLTYNIYRIGNDNICCMYNGLNVFLT